MKVQHFTFNPFQENTYVVWEEKTHQALIIDPGCIDKEEQEVLTDFIQEHQLNPVRLLNTHCHIDHIFGNRFIHEHYKLPLEAHEAEVFNIEGAKKYSQEWGLPKADSPLPHAYIEEGQKVKLGDEELEVLFVPGHSPGHVAFWCQKDNFILSGDVLFFNSIGRTDLPGGDFDTLLQSIEKKMLPLPADCKVFAGHGPQTDVGYEMRNNPFLKTLNK